MASKNNIRSMRFSDEIIEMIEQQTGNTFTQKFENLVTRCCWELPAKERELAEIQKSIDQERKRLVDLRQATHDMYYLSQQINNAKKSLEAVATQAERIAAKCNTD